ncbi:apyrase [Malassezia caprae]|uniref:Apyrase n=1 Tax=Malassezia caprae TaxID=1381934 RepID=A0AAF0E693_9BASI|nr:apyrase [Malassezia caprae]
MVPPQALPHTPIYIHATAGMRLLPPEQRQAILLETCRTIREFPFARDPKVHDFTGADPDSACGGHVRVISGEEEGLFGWLAINYLMGGFEPGSQPYGFLDMGGASSQIAFEPSESDAQKDLFPVSLYRLDGSIAQHHVFVTTFLGFGTNEARLRYLYALADQASTTQVSDPCLPPGLRLPGQEGLSDVVGTGSFAECLLHQQPLLNRNATCAAPPCPFHGVHVPSIQFAKVPFVGVSEYWYSADDVFGLGGAYDRAQFHQAAEAFCQSDWHALAAKLDRHEYPKQVTLSRLQMQCFKAAWVSTFLHEGLALPREDSARFFQSVNEVQGVGVSWTLGKALLEVSKEVSRHVPASAPLASSWVPVLALLSIMVGALYMLWRRFGRRSMGGWMPVPVSESTDAEEHRMTITMPSDTAPSRHDLSENKSRKKSGPWGRFFAQSFSLIPTRGNRRASSAPLPQLAPDSRRPSAARGVPKHLPYDGPLLRDGVPLVPAAWASMSDSEHGPAVITPTPHTPTPPIGDRSRGSAFSRTTSPIECPPERRGSNTQDTESSRDDSTVISTALSSGLRPSRPPSRVTSPMPMSSAKLAAPSPLLSPPPSKAELRGRISPVEQL